MAEFESIDADALTAAYRRGREAGRAKAVAVRYELPANLVVDLGDGRSFTLNPARLPGLVNASIRDLSDVTLEGTGSTLRFPRLDADFSIARVIEDFVAPSDWTTMAAE